MRRFFWKLRGTIWLKVGEWWIGDPPAERHSWRQAIAHFDAIADHYAKGYAPWQAYREDALSGGDFE